MAKKQKKEVSEIEVIKPQIKKGIKATPKVNIGTYKGKPRYKKGVEYEFSKDQIQRLTKNKLI